MLVRLKTKYLGLKAIVDLTKIYSLEQSDNNIFCYYPPCTIFGFLFEKRYVEVYKCETIEEATKIMDDYYNSKKLI